MAGKFYIDGFEYFACMSCGKPCGVDGERARFVKGTVRCDACCIKVDRLTLAVAIEFDRQERAQNGIDEAAGTAGPRA